MSLMKPLVYMLKITALTSALIAAPVLAEPSNAQQSAASRVKPVGETCMEGQPCAAPVVAVAAGPRTGEQVYTAKCSLCHGTGALGSPKVGDAAAWAPRLAARKLEGLVEHAINGFNSMPPKGTCADCSDDEIKSAVKHMVDRSK